MFYYSFICLFSCYCQTTTTVCEYLYVCHPDIFGSVRYVVIVKLHFFWPAPVIEIPIETEAASDICYFLGCKREIGKVVAVVLVCLGDVSPMVQPKTAG